MTKLYSFIAILCTAFMLVFTPVQKAEAGACDTVCLLQMGNQTVQDLGTRLKAILGSIQQTVMTWFEDAKAWLDKYAQKAWSWFGTDLSQVTIPSANVPNLAGKETGIAPGKSYKISGANTQGSMTSEEAAAAVKDQSINSATAALSTGTIDKRAEAKQNELLRTSGTLQGTQYENSKKSFIAQQETIDALAKALVAKNTLSELEKLGDELDQLRSAMQLSSVPKPEKTTEEKIKQGIDDAGTIGGAIKDTILHPLDTLTGKKNYVGDAIDSIRNRDLNTAVKDNLRVRFMLDKLLIMQQQILAFRLKNVAARGIREMESVPKISPIEIIVPQALPTPQDKLETPGK